MNNYVQVYEPGRLEVFITVLAGKLAGKTYADAVDHLGLRGDERVLDFGTGSGNPALHMAPRLLPAGGRLTCLDVSRTWLELAQRRLRKYPNVDFVLGDIRRVDVPDAVYDVVFVHFTLHEIAAGERDAIVRALAHKLRPGGRLYIREPLRMIGAAEIRSAAASSGLVETKWSTSEIKTQGPVVEAIYCKPG